MPPQAYELDDSGRLLTPARFVLMRTMVLAQAFHLTGRATFARRARHELLHAAAYPDWGPEHLLDTAELCTAVALGYDWLYDTLDDVDRRTLLEALRDLGLGQMPADHWCWTRHNNWNQVCCGGATLAALVLEDTEPQLAAETLARTRAAISHGMQAYAPDGVSPEGVSYWSYGATYNALMFSALHTAHGEDPRDLMAEPLRRSAIVRSLVEAPSQQWWSYADSFSHNRIEPALLWFADLDDAPHLAESVWRQAANPNAYLRNLRAPVQAWLLPLALIWPAPPDKPLPFNAMSRAWHGRGSVPLAILRHAGHAQDPKCAAFLGIKGGSPSVSHAHMDIGSFVAELAGKRWAIDLDGEAYHRVEAHFAKHNRTVADAGQHAGLWDMSPDSARWSLRRYANAYHNTLTISDHHQNTHATSEFLSVTEEPYPQAVLDLTPTYAGQATRVIRKVAVSDANRLTFEDQITGVAPDASVTWTWITDANVVEESSHALRLTKGGRSVWLRHACKDVGPFKVEAFDRKRPEFESPNPGVLRIRLVSKHHPKGRHRFDVELTSDSR
ncbi:MAG: heparinase II/III family protein [Planctomycetota bacterium]